MMTPETLSILRSVFTDARERTVAIGMWCHRADIPAALPAPLAALAAYILPAAFFAVEQAGPPTGDVLLAAPDASMPGFEDDDRQCLT